MTDKVQKIRKKVARIQLYTQSEVLKQILDYIDSLQEEPVSEQNLSNVERTVKNWKEEPVSEDLEEAASVFQTFHRYATPFKAYIDGAKWQKEQFENNRLKHCNSITNEQAELEQGFIDQHLDKHQRMPTFLDAIEYGMQLQKEQIMENAIKCEITWMDGFMLNYTQEQQNDLLEKIGAKVGDKVKLVIIKEE